MHASAWHPMLQSSSDPGAIVGGVVVGTVGAGFEVAAWFVVCCWRTSHCAAYSDRKHGQGLRWVPYPWPFTQRRDCSLFLLPQQPRDEISSGKTSRASEGKLLIFSGIIELSHIA